MPNSDDLNEQYQAARNELQQARNMVEPGSDEDEEIGDAMAALDRANLNRIKNEYSEGTANLQAAVGKLESVRNNINANPVSGGLDDVNAALGKVNSLVAKFDELASGGGA